jgi:hypothetical protein
MSIVFGVECKFSFVFDVDNKEELRSKIYGKQDDFAMIFRMRVVLFFVCSKIPGFPAYCL